MTDKAYNEMTVAELDKWCQNNSGTLIRDLDNNSILMMIKESIPSKPGDPVLSRQYKMRILNLTYLTIGSATEGKLWEMLYDPDRSRMSVGGNIGQITSRDIANYGQKKP